MNAVSRYPAARKRFQKLHYPAAVWNCLRISTKFSRSNKTSCPIYFVFHFYLFVYLFICFLFFYFLLLIRSVIRSVIWSVIRSAIRSVIRSVIRSWFCRRRRKQEPALKGRESSETGQTRAMQKLHIFFLVIMYYYIWITRPYVPHGTKWIADIWITGRVCYTAWLWNVNIDYQFYIDEKVVWNRWLII